MATKRRRKNPATTGAVVVNPRKRRKSAKRRTTKRRNLLAVRTNRKRRKSSKRRNLLAVRTNRKRRKSRSNKRRTHAKRRNLLAVRTNRKRRKARANPRRRSHKRRANTHRRRSGARRRNLLAVRTNRKRRSSSRRRSNPRRRSHSRRNPGLVASIKGMFSKVPLIGGILGAAIGFAVPAFFGAVGVLPTSWVAKKLAPYAPWLDARAFYVASALLLAALVQKFLPIGDAKMKNNIALGIATGGAAVALYKHASGSKGDLSGEYGLLEYGQGDDFSDGYAVIPGYAGMGAYQAIPGYGDDDFGAYQVMYGQEAL